MSKDKKKGLIERLNQGPVICAEGFLFEIERRGYMSSGEFVPMVSLEHPEALENLHKDFHTVVIWASKEERIKRLIDRGMEINDIKNRIKSQPTDEWWHSIGTLIINNDLDQLEIDIKNYINGFINE